VYSIGVEPADLIVYHLSIAVKQEKSWHTAHSITGGYLPTYSTKRVEPDDLHLAFKLFL
jgi:hypothetical protein